MVNDFFVEIEIEFIYDVFFIDVFDGFEVVCKCSGMYIGGIDECVLYYMVVEIIDNLMDEVVVGFVMWIEVILFVDYLFKVVDNGCGILIDVYFKFLDKFVFEVIFIEFYVGGKFLGKVYEILGGLYGVGLIVVNVLFDSLIVEVVKNKEVYQ